MRNGIITSSVRAFCRCGIRIPYSRNRCPAFDKVKCLETMFGDVGKPKQKLGYTVDPEMKAYFERKVTKGKKRQTCINCIVK